MPIGDFYSINSNKKITKYIYKLFGTLDLHSHIRLKPVINFVSKYINDRADLSIKILEVGCGSGVNAFEVYKKTNTNFNYIGVDIDSQSINTANQILKSFQKIKAEICFYRKSAEKFLEEYNGYKFDIILLADIIEHIKNPQQLLSISEKFLENNGLFVISLPTPLYPKIFGKKFAAEIGHLVDGYSLSRLDELFKNINCKRIIYKYNTGLFSNIGCWLYYNKLNFNNGYINLLKQFILYPFRFLDFYNNSKISCSLFAVYQKNEK